MTTCCQNGQHLMGPVNYLDAVFTPATKFTYCQALVPILAHSLFKLSTIVLSTSKKLHHCYIVSMNPKNQIIYVSQSSFWTPLPIHFVSKFLNNKFLWPLFSVSRAKIWTIPMLLLIEHLQSLYSVIYCCSQF